MPRETHFPIVTLDEHHKRYEEWKAEQRARFSQKAKSYSEEELKRLGFTRSDSTTYIQRSSIGTETMVLDDKGRKKEYMLIRNGNYKSHSSWKYDNDGFIIEEESKRGSGYGFCTSIIYEENNDTQNKTPTYLSIQYFFGNPAATLNSGSIKKGKNDGSPVIVNLKIE